MSLTSTPLLNVPDWPKIGQLLGVPQPLARMLEPVSVTDPEALLIVRGFNVPEVVMLMLPVVAIEPPVWLYELRLAVKLGPVNEPVVRFRTPLLTPVDCTPPRSIATAAPPRLTFATLPRSGIAFPAQFVAFDHKALPPAPVQATEPSCVMSAVVALVVEPSV